MLNSTSLRKITGHIIFILFVIVLITPGTLLASFEAKTFLISDTIIVHKDVRADLLAEKQAAINKVTSGMTSTGMYRGYRLQVLNTRSRDEAFKLKADFLQWFPSQQTYVLFQSPYFKVRVGNFRERSDALSFKNQISRYYSQNVYIVEDLIEYTPSESASSN